MSTLNHNGIKVNYRTNDLGNTTVWVYLSKGVCVNAVRCSAGEIYTVTLQYGDEALWFGAFTMESNTPGHAQVQIAPWLPLLQPIFDQIK